MSDHDPLCPPYLGARTLDDGCQICDALATARADERERIAQAITEQCPFDEHFEAGPCACSVYARIARATP